MIDSEELKALSRAYPELASKFMAAADRIESLESELESANEKIVVCDLDIQYLQARMQRHLTLSKNKENK